MCNIISDYWTTLEPIEVYKRCRVVNDKELRSEFTPDARSKNEEFGMFNKDVLYRHRDDIGKRLLVTDEAPGFCAFKSLDDMRNWVGYITLNTMYYRYIKVTIPVGAHICEVRQFDNSFGYATSMLEIDCNDPWPMMENI